MDLGLGFSLGRRVTRQRGVDEIDNPNGEKASGRVYTLEAGLGLWRGLSARVTFPLLDVSAEESGHTDRQFDIGDLSARLSYQWVLARPDRRLVLGVNGGAWLPTGGRGGESEIPSNANFVSGTVDPQVGGYASFDTESGLGLHLMAQLRAPVYEQRGFQAGFTAVVGGGLHVQLGASALPSLDVVALKRGEDQDSGAAHDAMGTGMGAMDDEGSGGTTVYVAPGLTWRMPGGPLAGFAATGRVQIPVYQHLNGVQLAEQFSLSLAVSYAFAVFGGAPGQGGQP